jgi:hypothetical protein
MAGSKIENGYQLRRVGWRGSHLASRRGVITTSPTSERMSSRASALDSGSASVSARRSSLVR